MATPNYELLKDAYAIIDGIPESSIALCAIRSEKGKSLDCGTVCCAAGWLASHPKFIELGLTIDPSDSLLFKGEFGRYAYSDHMAKVFGLHDKTAKRLFDSRQDNEPKTLSDKQIWLRRVRRFLKQKGQL